MRLLLPASLLFLAVSCQLSCHAPATGMPFPARRDNTRVLFGRFRMLDSAADGRAPALERYVRNRESQFRFCYAEEGLSRDSTLSAFAHVTIWLTAQGAADSVQVRSLPGGREGAVHGAVLDCVRARLRSWRFPEALGPDAVTFDVGFTWDPVPGPSVPTEGRAGRPGGVAP
jgi:hypothetical protein